METKIIEEKTEVTENQEKKKDSLKKKLVIGVIAVAAVLLLVFALAGARIENAIRKSVSSPESYYQWVEKKTVAETSSIIAELYNSYLAQMEKSFDTGYKAELEVAFSEAGQEVVRSLSGLAGTDLSWLESVSVIFTGNVNDTAMQSLVEFALGKDTIISMDIIMDYEDELFTYLAIPELSELYFDLKTEMTAEEVDIESAKQLLDILQKELPDSAKVEKMVENYFMVILDEINQVEKNSGVLKVEQIAQKCTELKVTIDSEAAEEIVEAVIEELKEDKDLKKYIIAVVDAIKAANIKEFELDMSGEEAYESFLASLNDIEAELDSLMADNETIIMTVSVDNKGTIIAREVEISNGVDATEFGIFVPRDGKELAVNAYVIPTENGEKYAIVGTGTESGDKVTGDFALEYNGAKIVNINVENLDIDSMKKGYINGNFTMKMPELIGDIVGSAYLGNTLSKLQFGLNIHTEESSSNVEFSLANGEEEWMKITSVSELFSAKKVTPPSEANTIVVEKEEDLEKYWNSIDWDGFIKHLEQTSLDSAVIDVFKELSEMTFEEFYGYIQYFLY